MVPHFELNFWKIGNADFHKKYILDSCENVTIETTIRAFGPQNTNKTF